MLLMQSKVINTKSTYAPYAIYYYAVISYEEGDDKDALEYDRVMLMPTIDPT